jgi:hypothetical protein
VFIGGLALLWSNLPAGWNEEAFHQVRRTYWNTIALSTATTRAVGSGCSGVERISADAHRELSSEATRLTEWLGGVRLSTVLKDR